MYRGPTELIDEQEGMHRLQDRLIYACKFESLEKVQNLLAQGAKPYPLDSKEPHPLALAVWRRNPDIANEIINALIQADVKPITLQQCLKNNKKHLKSPFQTFAFLRGDPREFDLSTQPEWSKILKIMNGADPSPQTTFTPS